jgi:Ca-activated chloride channel family protein
LTDEGMDEDAFIEKYGIRPFVDASRDHLSTFGLDVDTASYTRVRSQLREGKLPPPEAVRVEEFVNYFKQPYEVPPDETFGVFAEGMPAPFGAPGLELLKIGIKSREPRADERKPAALTFVVDTSGSMARDDRLNLVRSAVSFLLNELTEEDSLCLVAFGSQARLALPRTQANQTARILDAFEGLEPGGSTNLEAGLALGYRLADEAYSPDAVNRVILCSDGVANVGAKGPDELLKLVQVFAGRGIDLVTIGFGRGRYNDALMQRLADSGNGSCHFADSHDEAARILCEQLPPHLNVLARDAKAQVEFNPEVVARYRLLGYEKRKIADADFRNDRIDAGEVGHATLVTVLYEVQRRPGAYGPLGKVYLRWKDAAYRHLPVVERNYPLSEGLIAARADQASPELRLLACVAEFAELLRGSRWAADGSYAAVLAQLAQLPQDFRSRPEVQEVAELVGRAQLLTLRRWAEEMRTAR